MNKLDCGYNRDKAHIWFEEIEPTVYEIHTDKDYVLEYACINYDSLPLEAEDYDFESTDQFGNKHKGNICSFDPSGGPYMEIGKFSIENKVLKKVQDKGKMMFYFDEKN